MKAVVFPGQGAQTKGMGKELFDKFPELVQKADKILGYSIKDLCLKDKENKLNNTEFTQPALYVVNALSYEKMKKESNTTPDYLAGHSLGEYSALYAAGVFSFETGLKLVKKRGALMSKAKEGAMAAILNCPAKKIEEILKAANLATIDLANHNSPSQIVISGLKDDVAKSQPFFEKENAMFIPLNTSGAFHSRYMKDAEAEYGKYVKKFKFSKPEIPVISNVTAKLYNSKNITNNLISQISNCVKWNDSINYLLDKGEVEFIEMGVGDVLTKLIGKIRFEYNKKNDSKKVVEKKESGSKVESKEKKSVSVKKSDSKGVQSGKTDTWYDKSNSADQLVEKWNKEFPVGTKVKSKFYEEILETRTEATTLFGHRAAVYIKDYNGYFDLTEVEPA